MLPLKNSSHSLESTSVVSSLTNRPPPSCTAGFYSLPMEIKEEGGPVCPPPSLKRGGGRVARPGALNPPAPDLL